MNNALIIIGSLMLYVLVGVGLEQKLDSQFYRFSSRFHSIIVCVVLWPFLMAYGFYRLAKHERMRRDIDKWIRK